MTNLTYRTTLTGDGPYEIEHNLDTRHLLIEVITGSFRHGDRHDYTVDYLDNNNIRLAGGYYITDLELQAMQFQPASLHGCDVYILAN
jgi:hypothetical protein